MTGYVYAETMLVKFVGPTANWYVVALASYLAPVAQARTAGELLKHVADSIVLNPEWVAKQKQLVALATRINYGTAAANVQATNEMNARQEQWKKMMRGETANFNDILNGLTFTRDPTTGVEREVPTGPGGQKWIDNQNNVASGAMQPGPAYHPLEANSH
jgi:hypothetical protein